MISFTSILTTIKGLSLAAKVGLSIGAVAVVAGGTAGTVAIINANQPHEETQIVADNPNDDNSPSEQEDTQIGETGEAEDDNNKTEQTGEDNKPTANNSQTTTQKPNNSSVSNNQSNNSSSSKPSTSTTQPSQPSQPSAPSQPSQPTQPTKKPDYNLNDRYVAGYYNYPFYTYDPNRPDLQQCTKVEEKSFFAVVRFSGSSADLFGATISKATEYAKTKGYSTECWGAGAGQMSWQDAINQGIALDEAKCAQYGLSCGRW